MIYAFDTFYHDHSALTVCIGFENWQSKDLSFCCTKTRQMTADYVSGQFYKRELPCILDFMDKEVRTEEQDLIIVDGYVFLDDEGKLGLGGHLFHALGCKTPVIGVAKTNFLTLLNLKKEVLRGQSAKPLYITAIGVDLSVASAGVSQMTGNFRIPDLLKKLDMLTKSAVTVPLGQAVPD